MKGPPRSLEPHYCIHIDRGRGYWSCTGWHHQDEVW